MSKTMEQVPFAEQLNPGSNMFVRLQCSALAEASS